MKNVTIILIAILFFSCEASRFSFRPQQHLSMDLFSQMDAITGRAGIEVDSVAVFKATLKEVLVERDAVGERRIRNEASTLPRFNVLIKDKYFELYLFRIYSRPNDNYCVWLSTGFNPYGCISIGPSFFGNIRINQFNTKRELELNDRNGVYYLAPLKNKTPDIYFIADSNLLRTWDRIRIHEVIRKDTNDIAGSKPIVFDIDKVFGDPNTLLFTYQFTLKK